MPVTTSDTHLGLRFWIQIEGIKVAGFNECNGFTIETETFEYAEGGLNTFTHKLPVRVKYGNITLRRGLDQGHDLFTWYHKIAILGEFERRNISIMVYPPQGGDPIYQWDLMGAYTVKWIGPDMKTEAGSSAVEAIELAHRGLTAYQHGNAPSSIGEAAGEAARSMGSGR